MNQMHDFAQSTLCGPGEMTQPGKCLLCEHKDLSPTIQNSCEKKIYVYIVSLGEVETEGPQSLLARQCGQVDKFQIQWETLPQKWRWKVIEEDT